MQSRWHLTLDQNDQNQNAFVCLRFVHTVHTCVDNFISVQIHSISICLICLLILCSMVLCQFGVDAKKNRNKPRMKMDEDGSSRKVSGQS